MHPHSHCKLNKLKYAWSKYALSKYAFFESQFAQLAFCKDEQVIGSYDKDKEKYKNLGANDLSITFKDIDAAEGERKYYQRRTLNFKDQKRLLNRLLPNKEVKDTSLSQFYSTKYSSLFEPSEQSLKKNEYRRSSLN